MILSLLSLLTLRPEAEEAIARRRREAWDGTAARRVEAAYSGARTIGSLALVRVGHSVWTDTEKRKNLHDEAMGGIVLEIVSGERIDHETGERIDYRRFRCYDPMADWAHAFGTFDEYLIPIDGAEYTAESTLINTVRRFCREIASRGALKGGRSVGVDRGHVGGAPLAGDELQLLTDAFHLAAALGAGAV